jgi:acyl carrier protein
VAEPMSERIRLVLLEVLGPRLGRTQSGTVADPASGELTDLGLVDSSDLLDVVLDVEQRCGVIFNPERISFDSALSLEGLAAAFERVE